MDRKEKLELARAIAKYRYIEKNKPYLLYTPGKDQKPFFESKARLTAAFGGNRSGKTLWGLMIVLYECLGIHPCQKDGIRPQPPLYWRVVTTGFTNGIEKVVRPTIESLLPRNSYTYHEKKATYTLSNGSRIELMSYDQDRSKFGGASRDGTMFDEEPPYVIYQECLMRVLDRKGRILFAMTPESGMSWIYDEVYLNQGNKGIECFHLSPYNNPALDKEEIDRMSERMDEDTKKIKIEGRFIHRSGLIYSDFSKKDHVIRQFAVPDSWTRYIAIDPGVHNPTGVVWMAVDPDNNYYVYDELLLAEKTVGEIAHLIKQKSGNQKIKRTIIDWAARATEQTSGYSVKGLFAKHGIYTSLGKKDLRAGVLKVQEALKPNLVTKKPTLRVFENCPCTIKEFLSYVWDDYKHAEYGINKKEKPKKKDDHLLDCIRYLVLARVKYIDQFQRMIDHARNPKTGYWR